MVSASNPGRSDFFAVELSDGDLYVVLNLGGQTQRFLVGTGVNDGQAHHVIVEHSGRSLTFTFDGQQSRDRLLTGDDGSLDLGSNFFVGGTSHPERLPWLLYSRMRDYYRGCLWDLRFDGGEVVELDELRRQQGMFQMITGCASMPVDCTATSCQHGGVCRERWSGQDCYCLLTAYTGRRCQRGQLSENYRAHSFATLQQKIEILLFIFIHCKGSRTNSLTNVTKQQPQYIYILH